MWTPDGRSILFTSNKFGRPDLWAIPMQDGKGAGSASVVKRDFGEAYLYGVTNNGSLTYSTRRREYATTLAEIERGSQLPRVRERLNGHAPRWSPDGKLLAFGRPRSVPGSPTDLVVLSMDGEERKYPHTGASSSTIVSWFRDGKSVLQRVTSADGTVAFFRIDLASGTFTKVLTVGSEQPGKAWFLSADDRTLYFTDGDNNQLERLIAYDLATGGKSVITGFPALPNIAVQVSPDHTMLGVQSEYGPAKERAFGVISLPEGKYQELYRAPTSEFSGRDSVMWTADSKALLFLKADQETKRDVTFAVMQLPVTGGPPTAAGWRTKDGQTIFPRPGSFTVALFAQEAVEEFWSLDNVLAVLKKTR